MINSLVSLDLELEKFPVHGIEDRKKLLDNIRIRKLKIKEWMKSRNFQKFQERTRTKADHRRKKNGGKSR